MESKTRVIACRGAGAARVEGSEERGTAYVNLNASTADLLHMFLFSYVETDFPYAPSA